MTKAILISTNGPYLDAIIDIAGESLCVFNEFSLADHSMPRLGEEFDIEFSNELSDDEDWEAMFSSNPDHRVGLEKIEGWRYRAFGKVISINPVKVDCGLFVEEDVFHSNDPRVSLPLFPVSLSHPC